LRIPLLNKNKEYERPFVVYEIKNEDYVFLKASSTPKDYIPQFPLVNKPSSFYKKKNFIESNVLVYINRDLFPHILNKTTRPIEQGQSISEEDFKKVKIMVKSCFDDKKNQSIQGNRYRVRVE
jgi:hypothetical protein